MKEKNMICSECGAVLNEEHAHNFEGCILCEECLHRVTTTCDNCGERIWREDAEGDSSYTLCQRCYENHYTNCEECGRLIHNNNAFYFNEDDYPYCRECFDRMNENVIKDYSYKPVPVFYGNGKFFYGVELEIDKGGEYDENAEKLINIANNNAEHIYCKHDGSICEGFEIVSHPMTLDYHMNNMNWKSVFEKAVGMGYLSHKTSTCGLHIHCSRLAFGETYEQQERAIGRVVFFVEKHWAELVKFSRRTIDNLNRWAARYATISTTTEETYKKAKDKRLGRYVAVNLENCNTIEFRLFRGTLRYKTFSATLQLVDEICRCATDMSDYEFENMSWSDFVSRISPKKAELIEYLKEKRLYVNELQNEGGDE